RGRALGYYIERRESGAAGAFQAKSREEADKILEETIAKIAAKQAVERAKANTHRSVCERVPSIPSSYADPIPSQPTSSCPWNGSEVMLSWSRKKLRLCTARFQALALPI